jgi:hypothetical protein
MIKMDIFSRNIMLTLGVSKLAENMAKAVWSKNNEISKTLKKINNIIRNSNSKAFSPMTNSLERKIL